MVLYFFPIFLGPCWESRLRADRRTRRARERQAFQWSRSCRIGRASATGRLEAAFLAFRKEFPPMTNPRRRFPGWLLSPVARQEGCPRHGREPRPPGMWDGHGASSGSDGEEQSSRAGETTCGEGQRRWRGHESEVHQGSFLKPNEPFAGPTGPGPRAVHRILPSLGFFPHTER